MKLPIWEQSPYLRAGSSWLDKRWPYKAPPNAGDNTAWQSSSSHHE